MEKIEAVYAFQLGIRECLNCQTSPNSALNIADASYVLRLAVLYAQMTASSYEMHVDVGHRLHSFSSNYCYDGDFLT